MDFLPPQRQTCVMKSIYYEQGDVLRLRISTELAVCEISQGDIHICYAADGSIAELVIQNAGQHGVFEPEIKLPRTLCTGQSASIDSVGRCSGSENWCGRRN